jgi:hypothetical protein
MICRLLQSLNRDDGLEEETLRTISAIFAQTGKDCIVSSLSQCKHSLFAMQSADCYPAIRKGVPCTWSTKSRRYVDIRTLTDLKL